MSEKLREPAAELKGSQPAAEVSRKAFIKEVMKMTGGENILECIQCGSCAGGCPTRFVMDYSPMQIIKMVNLGMKEEVLSSSTIWSCSTCHTCATRCPRDINFSSLMMSLKNEAIRENTVKNVANTKFHQSFFDIIYKYGKLHEPELMVNLLYKSDLRGLRGNVTLGMRLLKRHKLQMRAPKMGQVPWMKDMVEKTNEDGSK